MTCRGCTHTHCACTVHAHTQSAYTVRAPRAHARRTQVRLPAVLPPVRHRAAAQPAGHLMELATVLVRPGTRARRGLRPVWLPPGRNARQPDVPSPQPCAHTCTQVARPAASAAAGRLVDGAALLLARLAAGRQPARAARPLRLRDGREHRRQHPSRRVREQVSQRAPAACTGKPAQASRGPRVPAWLGGGCEHATLLRKPARA